MTARPETRLDFLTWYENWLDNAHASLDEEEQIESERFEEDISASDYDDWLDEV
jgi:hypothetical protein